jgi:signal transduction histidine kinase
MINMAVGAPGDARRSRWAARKAAPVRCLRLVGLAVAEAAVVCAVAGAATLIPLGVGVYLFPSTAAGLRALADRSRSCAARWSGVPVTRPPQLPTPRRGGLIGRALHCWAILVDRAFWRESLWAIVDPLSGGLLVSVPLTLLGYGLVGVAVQPFLWQVLVRAGDTNWYGMIHVQNWTTALLAIPLGLAFVAAGVWSGPWWLGRHALLTRSLLAPGRAELTRRVEQLTDTRAEVTDSSAAELRRIERDLHDGAQARLVAMGMQLDAAERLLERDPDSARALVIDARQSSVRALQDLRNLVRGIHPPVLADRGLPDAVRALSLDSPLDVTVDATLAARLPPPVESAAYFAVSELLTNVAKHAGASRIDVELHHGGATLRITVTDNGRGGADASRGTGLHGIGRRLAAFDGTIDVHSPPGGPTLVRMEIPCALSSPKTSSS